MNANLPIGSGAVSVDRPAGPPPAAAPRLRPAAAEEAQPATVSNRLDEQTKADADQLKARITSPAMRVTTFQDETTGRPVLRIEDRQTGDLVEQYPSERLLRLFAAMRGAGGGGVIDESA